VRAGILSSRPPQNLRLRRAIANTEDIAGDPRYPLIFDPQTAGGLLASVPAAAAQQCVEALRAMGYARAAIIGSVQPRSNRPEPVTVRR
jgi:selenide,water dikinase